MILHDTDIGQDVNMAHVLYGVCLHVVIEALCSSLAQQIVISPNLLTCYPRQTDE